MYSCIYVCVRVWSWVAAGNQGHACAWAGSTDMQFSRMRVQPCGVVAVSAQAPNFKGSVGKVSTVPTPPTACRAIEYICLSTQRGSGATFTTLAETRRSLRGDSRRHLRLRPRPRQASSLSGGSFQRLYHLHCNLPCLLLIPLALFLLYSINNKQTKGGRRI